MRKIIVIALSALLLLSLALISFGDERETEVSYVVNSTAFEIEIPASISLNQEAVLPIELKENHGGVITVRVAGANPALGLPYRMKGQTTGEYLAYSVSDAGGTVYAPDIPITLTNGGIDLILTLDGTALKFAKNDTYKDYLTFFIQ